MSLCLACVICNWICLCKTPHKCEKINKKIIYTLVGWYGDRHERTDGKTQIFLLQKYERGQHIFGDLCFKVICTFTKFCHYFLVVRFCSAFFVACRSMYETNNFINDMIFLTLYPFTHPFNNSAAASALVFAVRSDYGWLLSS